MACFPQHHGATRRTLWVILGWTILVLIASGLAKAPKPREQGGRWFAPLLLDVLGAIVGGWIGSALFNVGVDQF